MTLDDALKHLAGRDRILVASDFDGTLSEIVPRPEDARPVDGAIEALHALSARPGVSVAVVSGRGLDDLVALVGDADGIELVGEHGSVWLGREAPRPESYDAVKGALESIAATVDGAWVESKHTAFSLHTRAVGDAESEERVVGQAEAALERIVPGCFERGLHVLDVRLSGSTKADAVVELRRGADGVLFIGDDTTDESVFRDARTPDVMVKVGGGETAAVHRVPGPRQVVDLLERLMSLRDSVFPGPR